MSRPRVLVTGAGGFLGRPAVAALAEAGWAVVAAGRRAPEVPGAAEALALDLLGEGVEAAVARAGCEAVLHLAWHDDPGDRWHGAQNLDWTAATLRLARAFAASGGRRLVLGSSCAVYDWAAGPVLSEGSALRPASLYGAAKAAAATLLDRAQGALGLGVAEARIFFCYGEGEPPGRLLPDLAAALRAGRPVPLTDGLQRRDYLHAADVGQALALVVGAELTGPVNVGRGEAVAVRDLATEAARLLGRPDLLQLGAIPRRPDDPGEIVAETARLRTLGFAPRLGLAEGLARALAAAP